MSEFNQIPKERVSEDKTTTTVTGLILPDIKKEASNQPEPQEKVTWIDQDSPGKRQIQSFLNQKTSMSVLLKDQEKESQNDPEWKKKIKSVIDF